MAKENDSISTADESGSATATLEAPQDGYAQAAEAEDVKDVFERVFGEKSEDSEDGKGRQDSTPSRQRRRAEEEERESLSTLDDAELDDTGEGYQDDADGDTGETPQDDVETDETAGETEKPEDENADGFTLNPLLMQAAKRSGLDDSEIQEFVKTDPNLAVKTFTRLAQSFNNLSAQFAQLGQQHLSQTGESTLVPTGVKTPPPSGNGHDAQMDFLRELYGEERLREFSDRYDEQFVDTVLKPLVRPIEALHQQSQSNQRDQVVGHIRQFFNGLTDDFHGLYGKQGEQLSDEQRGNREKLAMLADQIRTGASLQRIDMTVPEALRQANQMFAMEHISALERKRLTKAVQKRSQQRTHKPSHSDRVNSKGASAPRSTQSAIEAYAKKAREIGFI